MSTESNNSQAIRKKPVAKLVQQPILNKAHEQDIVLINSSEPLKKHVTSAVKKSVPISPSANNSHSAVAGSQSSKSNKITHSTKTPSQEKSAASINQIGAPSANVSVKRQNSTNASRPASSSKQQLQRANSISSTPASSSSQPHFQSPSFK